MKTSLGLDLGTNSLGWCLYEMDGDTPKRIIDIGVRIFGSSPQGAGRDPKSGASLAVDRRDARAMRRRRDRYIGRRSAMLRVLMRYHLMPPALLDAKALEKEDPYELRVQALDEKLEPYEFGRALFHLNQRRGFKSNRKADRKSKDNEGGKIASGSKALDSAMDEMDARTYGEFLLKRDLASGGRLGKRVRMRPDAEGYDFYPDRRHYKEEFEKIWAAQAAYHPDLLTEEARAAIHRVIFYQRPLKEQVVGFCTFAGRGGVPADEKRLPKAHPLFQERRLYEEVNQLRIVSAGAPERDMSVDDRNALIHKLRTKQKVSFSTLAKTIKLAEGERFNKESENRKDLLGNEVYAVMADKKRFAGRWGDFPLDEQLRIIDKVENEESPEALLEWLKTEYALDDSTAEAVANAKLPEGYGRFGETATRMLLDQLKASVITYDKAALAAGFHHSDFRTGEAYDELPYYGAVLTREIAPGKEEYGDDDERQYGKITNPTVHIGMNQLRRVVNAIIKKHGRPDVIFVELARELKLNEKQKDKHKERIKKDTDAAKKYSEKLGEMEIRDSGRNRLALRLWTELCPDNILDRKCPYCGEALSPTMLLNGEYQIDHIIPYSKSLDDSIANKTICHINCNHKKGNLTPWQKWHGTPRWPAIQDQVARMHKSKQWRFGPDAMERVEKDGGFIARQLTDTQYLARLAAQYLGSLYPEKGEGSRCVYAVPGRMTAMLRRLWGLNSILPDHNYATVENPHSNAPKNRLDHRHHAIDAAIIGLTNRSLLQRIATAAGRAESLELDKLFADLPKPWPTYWEDLQERLFATTVSFKPDHGRKGKRDTKRDSTSGRLHNDTAYGLTGKTNASGVPIVVRRIGLLSLRPQDLTDPDRMTDKELQSALYSATQGASGKEFEAALKAFAKGEGPYQGIRRVRVREALNVIPIRDAHGKIYKAYKGDANARMDIWRMPDGKWVTKWKDRDGAERSSVVSMFDAHQANKVEMKPHPAAKRVLSLRQNDLVAVERDGGPRQIMRVVKFASSGEIALALHNEAGALKARDVLPNEIDPFKYFRTGASGLKKAKARQVRIDELGQIFDPGPRD